MTIGQWRRKTFLSNEKKIFSLTDLELTKNDESDEQFLFNSSSEPTKKQWKSNCFEVGADQNILQKQKSFDQNQFNQEVISSSK